MEEINSYNLSKLKFSKISKNLDQIFKGFTVENLNKKQEKNEVTEWKDQNKNKFVEKNAESLNYYSNNVTKLPPIYSLQKENHLQKLSEENGKNRKLEIFYSLSRNNKLSNNREESDSEDKQPRSRIIIKKDKKVIDKFEVPAPGRYNPNYKSIFRKSPAVVIRNSKRIVKSISTVNMRNKDFELDDKISYFVKNDYLNKSLNNSLSSNENKSIDDRRKYIKGIDFNMFMKRKDSFSSHNFNDILSYIEPINYGSQDKRKVKSIDFKKMIDRHNDMPVRSPPVGHYNLSNESIGKRSVELQKKLNQKKINKSKFISDYHPSLTYRMVKF